MIIIIIIIIIIIMKCIYVPFIYWTQKSEINNMPHFSKNPGTLSATKIY